VVAEITAAIGVVARAHLPTRAPAGLAQPVLVLVLDRVAATIAEMQVATAGAANSIRRRGRWEADQDSSSIKGSLAVEPTLAVMLAKVTLQTSRQTLRQERAAVRMTPSSRTPWRAKAVQMPSHSRTIKTHLRSAIVYPRLSRATLAQPSTPGESTLATCNHT